MIKLEFYMSFKLIACFNLFFKIWRTWILDGIQFILAVFGRKKIKREKILSILEFAHLFILIHLSPPSTTKVPYANSLDLDETPNYSASHLDPNYLTLRKPSHQL